MQPTRIKLVAAMGWQQEPIGEKLSLEIFCKIYLCNSNRFFIPSAFMFFYILRRGPSEKLVSINHILTN